ncbi:hypothetical protein DEO72_LG10g1583 [Vigna unguiculata]|uniref:Uncharacterized protein n=1 Tax=Vigna unguiculata TaxID=3917 RepID=A0A4D6N941_VIGUN|nr:hypothetical protein DEO72_LG10g1583 [Vigna unguiculata]
MVVAGRGAAMVRAGEDDGASRWPAWLKRCRCVKEEDAWWWPTRRVCYGGQNGEADGGARCRDGGGWMHDRAVGREKKMTLLFVVAGRREGAVEMEVEVSGELQWWPAR